MTGTSLLRVFALLALLAGFGCGKVPHPSVSPTPAPEPTPVSSTIRLEEVTKDSGLSFLHLNGAAGKKWMPETMGAGVAAFDADGDGRVDLLFVNGRYWPGDPRGAAGQPTLRFFRNVTLMGGPIRFVDATKESGLDVALYGMGAAVGDLNGDGSPDLLVTGLGECRLFLNDGKGRFRDATKGSGLSPIGWATSAALADFDGDGILDAFVGHYVSWTPATDLTCTLDGRNKSYCTPERYPGTTSRLFKGLGNGKFRDVTVEAGLSNALGKALGVAIRDVDGDGRLDIAVANDTAPNNLFRNVKSVGGVPLFSDVAIETGVAVGEDGRARGAMGIAFGDTKNEGGVSLAIGNFSNEMWSFWSAGPKGDFFVDESVMSGIGRTSLLPLTFGVAFADLDQDGILDLIGLNGHVENSIHEVQPVTTYAEAPLLFRGLGKGRFADVTSQAGESFTKPVVGRGLAVADFDGDGRPDFVLTENGGPAHLFRNVTPGGNSSVVIRFVESGWSPAVGTRVVSRVNGRARTDEVSGGDGYLSVSERSIRIGLGGAASADEITVRWPDGTQGSVKNIRWGLYVWKKGSEPVIQ